MRHAGVVYTDDSPVVARGKKFAVGTTYVERGETRFEGYVEPDGTSYLAHLTFPYRAGDVLLIAADRQGANKIEPVLTYQMQGDSSAWDTRLNGVGTTNLHISTSNGYSPHLYPEYITDMEYFYGAAPRPGFMGRFLVGEGTVFAPYWPVSPNSFGGQIGASANGDQPGDIYRLIGGIVLRRVGRTPMYAGYIGSAFILPQGSNNNRVVAPGSEDLHGPTGEKGKFFLVGLRPGSAYEVGATFRPAVQIDPIVPASIRFVLTYPDGRQQTADGVGDRFGSFAAASAWPLDVPGVYRYQLRATWNGFEGRMPGLPDGGGVFFVYSTKRPPGVNGLRLDGASQRTFSAASNLTITGTSGAASVQYALIMPGAVIDQGTIAVTGGRFQYVFNPAAVHAKVPLYDIVNLTTGNPQIGRVVHLTLFAEERAPDGTPFCDFVRVILRGTTSIAARTMVGAAASDPPASPWAPPSLVPLAAMDERTLRDVDVQIDRAVRTREFALTSRTVDTIVPGRHHERFQQWHRGLPVVGGEVTRQTGARGTISLFGTVAPNLDVDPTPAVTSDQAHAIVEKRAGEATNADPATLTVLPLDHGGAALAWRLVSRTGTDVHVWFIDAQSADVLLDYSDLKHQQLSTFDLRGDSTRATAALAGRIALDPADEIGVADRDGLELRRSAAATYEYYVRRFNRRGIDGRDGTTIAMLHPGMTDAAFWDGRMMIFGDRVRPSPSVVAHEWTHAVVDVSSNHVYRNETATIDEALATIMADAVADSTAIVTATSEVPSSNRVRRVYDAAIAHGADRARMEQLLYRAVVYMLPARGGFTTLRAAMIQSARDMDGAGGALELAIEEAWRLVP